MVGAPCSLLDSSLYGVNLGYWHFKELFHLEMYYINGTSVMYGFWMCCGSCDVLWLRVLCDLFSLLIVDQVLVLDFWCSKPLCIHQ